MEGSTLKSSEQNPWVTHASEKKYENPWITVTEHQVSHPNGDLGIYGVVHMKNRAVGVVPVDNEGCTWLVGQYRYTLEEYSWEIPEGGADPGDPLSGAQRELLEETGLEADDWTHLQTVHLSNSVTNERAEIYLAQGVRKVAEPTPEASEELTLKRLPLAEAVALVERGEITDSMSVIGLLIAANFVK